MTHQQLIESGLHECADDCQGRTASTEPVRNEAAERLTLNQKLIRALHPQTDWDEYDREVRRATVERIEALDRFSDDSGIEYVEVAAIRAAILDEEAARS